MICLNAASSANDFNLNEDGDYITLSPDNLYQFPRIPDDLESEFHPHKR